MTDRCRALGHHQLLFLRSSLSQDLQRYLNKSPMNRAAGDSLHTRLSSFLTPDLMSVFFYRLAHWLYANDHFVLAVLMTRLNFLVHKVSIGPQSCIGPGFRLPHPACVVFGGTAGKGLTLYALSICGTLEGSSEGPLESCPTLGDGVTLAAGAVVLGPVRIGDETKVAFHTRLDRDAPAGVLVVSRKRRLFNRIVASSGADSEGDNSRGLERAGVSKLPN